MWIYDLIIDLLPAWLLALLALAVAIGYGWRLCQYAPFWLPRVYFIGAMWGWAQLALFYGLNSLGVLTYAQGVAMTRITFVILMANELAGHAYVLFICRYIETHTSLIEKQHGLRAYSEIRAAGAQPVGDERPGGSLGARRGEGES
jgi:hypothetical protein